MSLDRVLSAIGRTFIGAGLLVFLFIAYQLWGTNLAEAKHQNQLKKDAQSLFANAGSTTTTAKPTPGQTTPPTTAPLATPKGGAVAVIRIPKINLEKAVVSGTGVSDLKKGPGHYTNTPLPGQPGNSAIAGHRTTYGAPFGNIGELEIGDEIDVTTAQGSFVYKVGDKKVVSPTDTSVLNPTKDNRLTLTTCHPKFSAAQRLIVVATLAPDVKPAAPTPTTAPPTTAPAQPGTPTTLAEEPAQADLSGTETTKFPAILWGFLTTIVGIVIWALSRLWKRWPAYILGAPVFLAFLYIFFENFARLLPANA